MPESRVRKSLLNAKVDMIFYSLTLALTFFSRKIFLDCLGAEFIGLTGTLQNLLGILNLAELGIGAAVAFALYKPLQQNNKTAIEEVVSFFGFMYRRVGLFVLGCAILLSVFLPLIFNGSPFSFGVIYFAYYSFLASSLISYFCNYRSVLLSADQKNYVVNVYFQSGNIIKSLLQLYLAWRFANYYAWLSLEFAYGGVCCWLLNKKIHQVYPWLNASVKKGAACRSRFTDIMVRTKQVFVHKIKDFLLLQSDQILVYAFVSLSMVAYYGNYTIIIARSTAAFSMVMNGMGAGIGNLIAEGNKTKILHVFWELISLRYFIGGIMAFGICCFIQPFITLWLGEKYLLSEEILYFLVVIAYVSITRGVVDMFNGGYGLYADTWSAWVEGGVNLSISLVGGYFLGLVGLLLGKLISLFLIVVLWKPYYLFSQGIHASYAIYWRKVLRFVFANALSFTLVGYCIRLLHLNVMMQDDLVGWVVSAAISISLFILVQGVIMYILADSFRHLLARLLQIRKSSNHETFNSYH